MNLGAVDFDVITIITSAHVPLVDLDKIAFIDIDLISSCGIVVWISVHFIGNVECSPAIDKDSWYSFPCGNWISDEVHRSAHCKMDQINPAAILARLSELK